MENRRGLPVVKSNIVKMAILIALIVGCWRQATAADPGDLDIVFGTDGFVTTDFGAFDVGVDIATQNDGKIVVSGMTLDSSTNFAVARYSSDGHPDITFGNGGVVTTTMGTHDFGRELVIQTNGKIVVGGSSDVNGDRDFALVRYNIDGSLDNSFDGDGIVITSVSGDDDEIWGLALQSDGKIIAVGENRGRLVAVRYDSRGIWAHLRLGGGGRSREKRVKASIYPG